MFRHPDIPTLMVCGLLIIGALVFYHVTIGRKKVM